MPTVFINHIASEFEDCHDDPTDNPDEGVLGEIQFSWLGTLQYIHVKKGTPHYFRVPRVVLISRRFVLSTAVDAAMIPVGYALGNVVFGEYERDEVECGISPEALAAGTECEPATLLVPLDDVLIHPEYKNFGVRDSIALLRLVTPVKSQYMLPVCLPYYNFLSGRRNMSDIIFHVDFVDEVPRDIIDEEKTVSHLRVLPKEQCTLDNDDKVNGTTHPKNKITCSDGCDFNSGAPSIIHESTGHWSIVALAVGGSPCPDPLKMRRSTPPPKHIQMHPYVPWITTAISGEVASGKAALDDPFGYFVMRSNTQSTNKKPTMGWAGHWWLGGLHCYARGSAAQSIHKFYHEIFVVKPNHETFLTYFLEIYAAHGTNVICVKVGMPYRLGQPSVYNLGTEEVKVRIPVHGFSTEFKFQVEAYGINATTTKSLEYDNSDSTEEEL